MDYQSIKRENVFNAFLIYIQRLYGSILCMQRTEKQKFFKQQSTFICEQYGNK